MAKQLSILVILALLLAPVVAWSGHKDKEKGQSGDVIRFRARINCDQAQKAWVRWIVYFRGGGQKTIKAKCRGFRLDQTVKFINPDVKKVKGLLLIRAEDGKPKLCSLSNKKGRAGSLFCRSGDASAFATYRYEL